MDPRFKKLHFENPIQISKTLQFIQTFLKKEIDNSINGFTFSKGIVQDNSDNFDPDVGIQFQSKKENENFWNRHQTRQDLFAKRVNPNPTTEYELTAFLSSPVADLKENPIEIWENLKNVYPKLYKTALYFLTIMESSVPSERTFSKAGNIIDSKRNRLKPEKLQK